MTQTDAPSICKGFLPSLSQDGTEVGWTTGTNLQIYNFATHETTSYAVPVDGQITSSVAFSPDGQYASVTVFADGNMRVYMLDRQTSTFVSTPVSGASCFTVSMNWRASDNTLALVCTDLTVTVCDPHNPNSPVRVVAPPLVPTGCQYVYGTVALPIDANLQQAAATCLDSDPTGQTSDYDLRIVLWSFAQPEPAILAQMVQGKRIYQPLLPYPDILSPYAVALSPGGSGELLITGEQSIFTANAFEQFSITRMLSGRSASQVEFSPDGTLAVGVVFHGYGGQIQAWQLSGGSDPIFVSRGAVADGFTLANNNTVGACGDDSVFQIWHIHPR